MTVTNKFGTVILFLAITLIGEVFIAAASASYSQEALSDSEISVIIESQLQKNSIPDFDPHILDDLRKDHNTLLIRGEIPDYVTQAEKQSWLNKLDKCKDNLKNDISSYLYPNGPIISYGWDTNGYFEVIIYKEIKTTDSQINEIYRLLNEDASKESIKKIPVIFKKGDFIRKTTPVNYSERYRPLIGAVQVTTQKDNFLYIATLSFAANRSDGTKGYVTAKHFANSSGLNIYQPTKSPSNEIGDVDEIGGHYADASFIKCNNVQPKIYIGNGKTVDVKGYFSGYPNDRWRNWKVYMSGRTSGLTQGKVTGVSVTINQSGWIYFNQVKAALPADRGDSGGPVFCLSGGKAYILGILSGIDGLGTSYFSPVSGIISDLGVKPLVA